MTLPLWTRALTPADYGDGKEDYAGLPAVNPRTDVSAAEWNALAQLAAGVARTLPALRGLIYSDVTGSGAASKVHWLGMANGVLVVSDAGLALDALPSGSPTITDDGGQITIAFPATLTSLDGQTASYAPTVGWARADDGGVAITSAVNGQNFTIDLNGNAFVYLEVI